MDVDDGGGGGFGGVEVVVDVFGDLTGVVVAVGPLLGGAERVERSDEEVEVEVEGMAFGDGERAAEGGDLADGAGRGGLFRGDAEPAFAAGVP